MKNNFIYYIFILILLFVGNTVANNNLNLIYYNKELIKDTEQLNLKPNVLLIPKDTKKSEEKNSQKETTKPNRPKYKDIE